MDNMSCTRALNDLLYQINYQMEEIQNNTQKTKRYLNSKILFVFAISLYSIYNTLFSQENIEILC